MGKTFYRTLAPAMALILTDRELIVIREEQRRAARDRYGGVWDYVPLGKVEKLNINERDGNLLVLIVELPENTQLECSFEASRQSELEEIVRQVMQIQGKHQ